MNSRDVFSKLSPMGFLLKVITFLWLLSLGSSFIEGKIIFENTLYYGIMIGSFIICCFTFLKHIAPLKGGYYINIKNLVCHGLVYLVFYILYLNKGLCDEIVLMCVFVFSMMELIASFRLNTVTTYFDNGMGLMYIEGDMLLRNYHPLDSVYMYRQYSKFRKEQESSWNKAVNEKRKENELSGECDDKEWDKIIEGKDTPEDSKKVENNNEEDTKE